MIAAMTVAIYLLWGRGSRMNFRWPTMEEGFSAFCGFFLGCILWTLFMLWYWHEELAPSRPAVVCPHCEKMIHGDEIVRVQP